MEEEKLPDRISEEANETRRLISPGAEKWLMRPIKCLNFGFVYLVDYMGSDASIAQSARVSYGKGTKQVSDDESLIRYLLSHDHTTPFEMVEMKFHVKLPIFVARQWIRHRTANVNEVSRRYSEVCDEFYMPELDDLRKQSKDNKQGRGEKLDLASQARVLGLLQECYRMQMCSYKEFTSMEFARELARIGVSVANYTEWYWKIDLRNLFNFLRLRLDSHAQKEIRVYAEAMAQIVKEAYPMAYKAFEDYQLNAVRFSGPELEMLHVLRYYLTTMPSVELEKFIKENFKSKREAQEFIEKIRKYLK